MENCIVTLSEIVNLDRYQLGTSAFAHACRQTLSNEGVLVLPDFIRPSGLADMLAESVAKQDQAFLCRQSHNVYLTPDDDALPADHPANRKVISSKGCICDDVIDASSPLRGLYDDQTFQRFIASVTEERTLYPYADSLSSINIHYAGRGQELGWHFDNSSFAITLLFQKPDSGSRFEYVKGLRDADRGEMNYEGVQDLLDGQTVPAVLNMDPGTLVLFRGRNAIHRVSPNESEKTRVLAVLAYNSEQGVELSESARMTFYGRLS